MSWINLRFTVSAASANALSDALGDLGALSISIDDAAAGTEREEPIFGEPGTAEDALWQTCLVSALFPADIDPGVMATAAAKEVGLDILPQFQMETVAEADWVRLTQAQFNPIRISSRLWIVPTWHDAPDLQAINIRLDPGIAFGTGSHPTTRLCLRWLEENIHGGESVLDYGCGSGILAIAAKKLGAGPVVGIDVDPLAVEAARHNAEQNGIAADFRLPDQGVTPAVEITVANILANPLKLMAPLLAQCTGRRIALSGILVPQAREVMACYSPWFAMATYAEESGWVCLHGHRLVGGTSS